MNTDLLIYNMKKNAKPVLVGLYKLGDTTTNFKTGATVTNFNIHILDNCWMNMYKRKRDFSYDLAYIAVNKDFSYGAYSDEQAAQLFIDKKDLKDHDGNALVLSLNDYLIINDNKYQIRFIEAHEYDKHVILELDRITNQTGYDADLYSLITAGWEGSIRTKISLDKLIRNIKNKIFSGTIPSNLLLWACCGDSINDSLYCVYHPDGIGTKIYNNGFYETDYIERGINGGLTSDGTNYIDTSYSTSNISLSSFHLSIYAHSLNSSGDLCGTDDVRIYTDGYNLSVESDSIVVNSNNFNAKSYLSVSSNAADDLTVYDGLSLFTDTNTRSTALTSKNMYLFDSNGTNNICSSKILTFCAGSKLTSAQQIDLYTFINDFNLELGRSNI